VIQLAPFAASSIWKRRISTTARYGAAPGVQDAYFGPGDGRWTCSVAIAASCSDPIGAVRFTPWGPGSTWEHLHHGGPNVGNPPDVEARLWNAATSATPPLEWNFYSTTDPTDDVASVPPESYLPHSRFWRPHFHLPPSATPSPDSDGMLAIFQPDGWALDLYAAVVLAGGRVVAMNGSWIDGSGSGSGYHNGVRASMLPSFAGILRRGELDSEITHALAAKAGPELLTRQCVFPAYAWDTNSTYTGALPMGSLLAIPRTVDLEPMRPMVSARGWRLLQCLREFGVRIVDRGGPRSLTVMSEYGYTDLSGELTAFGLAKPHLRLCWG
jgi:hypothetical protein